jgi:hypothetical protein
MCPKEGKGRKGRRRKMSCKKWGKRMAGMMSGGGVVVNTNLAHPLEGKM